MPPPTAPRRCQAGRGRRARPSGRHTHQRFRKCRVEPGQVRVPIGGRHARTARARPRAHRVGQAQPLVRLRSLRVATPGCFPIPLGRRRPKRAARRRPAIRGRRCAAGGGGHQRPPRIARSIPHRTRDWPPLRAIDRVRPEQRTLRLLPGRRTRRPRRPRCERRRRRDHARRRLGAAAPGRRKVGTGCRQRPPPPRHVLARTGRIRDRRRQEPDPRPAAPSAPRGGPPLGRPVRRNKRCVRRRPGWRRDQARRFPRRRTRVEAGNVQPRHELRRSNSTASTRTTSSGPSTVRLASRSRHGRSVRPPSSKPGGW